MTLGMPHKQPPPPHTHTQNMDDDKNGKITLSELETTGLALGFSMEQVKKLFEKWVGEEGGALYA